MTVPEVDHIFLGGQFTEEITMDNLSLNSPLSNNVYITYLKDDTWLSASILDNSKALAYPNPFSDIANLSNAEDVESIEVYNSLGVLIDRLTNRMTENQIGNKWQPGVYILKLYHQDGTYSKLKLIKNK